MGELVPMGKSLAVDPPNDLAHAEDRFGSVQLERALAAGLAHRVSSAGETTVIAWPPLVADRFQYLLRPASAGGQPDALEESAAFGRAFALKAQRFAEKAFAAWNETHKAADAVEYFTAAGGDITRRASVERVLQETLWRRFSAHPDDFLFVFCLGQWLALEHHEMNGAAEVLDRFAKDNPLWAPSCQAGKVLLDILTGAGVPDSIAELGHVTPDPLGLCHSIAVFGMVCRGQLDAAEELGVGASKTPLTDRTTSWAELLIPLLRGHLTQSIALCTAAQTEARAKLDRGLHTVAAYVKMMAENCAGDLEKMTETLNSALLPGRPEVLFTGVHAAFLNFQGMGALVKGHHFARMDFFAESEELCPAPGPFLGMGADTIQASVEYLDRPDDLDRAHALAARRRREAGYLVGSVQTASNGLAITFGPLGAQELALSLEACPLPLYAAVGELTPLLFSEPPSAIHQWLTAERIKPRGPDTMLTAMIVAAAHYARRQGNPDRADALQKIAATPPDPIQTVLNATFSPLRDSAAALSSRERQVALLAGSLSNADIAERLGISTSTVANHITNALRKTSATTRRELSTLASRRSIQPDGL